MTWKLGAKFTRSGKVILQILQNDEVKGSFEMDDTPEDTNFWNDVAIFMRDKQHNAETHTRIN